MADIKDRAKNVIDNTADKAKQVTDTVADNAEGVKNMANGIVDTVKENAKAAINTVSDYAGQLKNEANEITSQASEKVQKWAGDAYDSTANTVQDFGREMTTLVRKYPVQALLVGFGVGLLIGRCART